MLFLLGMPIRTSQFNSNSSSILDFLSLILPRSGGHSAKRVFSQTEANNENRLNQRPQWSAINTPYSLKSRPWSVQSLIASQQFRRISDVPNRWGIHGEQNVVKQASLSKIKSFNKPKWLAWNGKIPIWKISGRLKKDRRVLCKTAQVKYVMSKANENQHPVVMMCRLMAVSSSGHWDCGTGRFPTEARLIKCPPWK